MIFMLRSILKTYIDIIVRTCILTYIQLNLFFNKKTNKPQNDKDTLDKIYLKKETTCYIKDRVFKNEIDLSIIVPIYNGEKYIKRCINSVINNSTSYEYELILVNDGSTDKTLEIINGYKYIYPNKITVINKKNSGLSDSRNAGLKIARGKYISFLDHDDYITSNYIQILMNTAYGKDADIVVCSTANISNRKVISKNKYDDMEYNRKNEDKLLKVRSYAWGCVIRNTLFKNIQFPKGYWYEDMIMRFLILRNSNRLISISKVLHFRQIHNGQLTKIQNKSSNRCLEHLYLVELLFRDNARLNLEDDLGLYINILYETASKMVKRLDKLDKVAKKQAFQRACILVNENYNSKYNKQLNRISKIKSEIMHRNRYDLWLKLRYV